MLIDLKDRTALVTGAGRSVGRGIAEVLASAGAFVYVNDLHAERADEVVAAIESNGGSARALAFDVTDPGAVAFTYFATRWRLSCWLPGSRLRQSPTCWATRLLRPPTAIPGSRWTVCEAWPSPRRR